MECPTCGLINPATAQRCDCGFDFVSRTTKVSFVKPAELKIMSQDPSPLFFPFFGGHFLHALKFLYEQLNGDGRRRRGLKAAGQFAERFGPPRT